MKVSLKGQVIFYFEVDRALVKQLLELSKRHYDGECQRASAAVGAPIRPGSTIMQPTNGILRVWWNRFDVDTAGATEVRCTWDDLDLIAKICEYMPDDRASGIDWTLARTFRQQIGVMFARAGVIAHGSAWTAEFEV